MNKDKKLPDTIWKSNLSMENTLIGLFFVFYHKLFLKFLQLNYEKTKVRDKG